MKTPEEIAERIVLDLNRVISNRTAEQSAEAIATTLAEKFPEVVKNAIEVKQIVRIANELLREHRIAQGVDPAIGLRPVKPVPTTTLDIGRPENTMPTFEIVDPKELWIDNLYQRNLSARSLKKIADMIESWDWNAYSPLSCVRVDIKGKSVLKVVDGQHRGIAGASHPGISKLPIMVHAAPTVADEAASFVSLNTTAMAIHPLQLHQSALIAGNADAMTLQNVCDRAGIKICKHPGDAKEIGDTTAVNCIASVIDRRGAKLTGDMLELLVRAEFAPVGANDIRAIEFLMTAPEFRGKYKVPDLIEAMKGKKAELEREARQNMMALGGAVFKNIARAWVAASRKRKPALRAV